MKYSDSPKQVHLKGHIPLPVAVSDYEAVGQLDRAISEHANEIFDELNQKEIEASLIGQPGNMVFKNVVKKLLPDAGGTHLPVSWNIGQTGVYSFSWNMNNVFDKDKIAVVVFIQDEKTREIYQVGVSSQFILLTGITPGQLSGGPANVRVFSNPANDNIFIQFEEVLNTPVILEIYSITGTMISSEKIREGNSLYIYNTDYLREGVYVFRLLKNNTPILNGKVVITK